MGLAKEYMKKVEPHGFLCDFCASDLEVQPHREFSSIMLSTSIAAAALLLQSAQAAETVLGAYIFSRHGDRVSKATPPTILTDLGYSQVSQRGDYFRNRYVASSATSQIMGMSPDIVKYSQIAASAPLDTVLFPSTLGFLQGLYPPAGQKGSEVLRNTTTIESPLNGYQLIPVQAIGLQEKSIYILYIYMLTVQ